MNNYIGPIQRAMSCVVDDVVNVGGGYHASDRPHSLRLGNGEPVRLRGTDLAISVGQNYRIIQLEDPDDPRGPWKVSIVAYEYCVEEHDGQEIIVYHWHPQTPRTVATPHLHLEAGAGIGRRELTMAHLPTGRIAIEEFIRCLLRDFSVPPLKQNWDEVLTETQDAFDRWRTQ